jgi:hypothetical protein
VQEGQPLTWFDIVKINYAMDTEGMVGFSVDINRLFGTLILPQSCNNN